uniref:Uncharacterized protein n=1 Tax=Physcomitrium patens TaxID=3218 RepID=A0A2K1KHS4_PHYPA|nr:hypothetical protein PHYPA_007031 [Physcomitrium patens]
MITEQEVHAAAMAANVHNFISALPARIVSGFVGFRTSSCHPGRSKKESMRIYFQNSTTKTELCKSLKKRTNFELSTQVDVEF